MPLPPRPPSQTTKKSWNCFVDEAWVCTMKSTLCFFFPFFCCIRIRKLWWKYNTISYINLKWWRKQFSALESHPSCNYMYTNLECSSTYSSVYNYVPDYDINIISKSEREHVNPKRCFMHQGKKHRTLLDFKFLRFLSKNPTSYSHLTLV